MSTARPKAAEDDEARGEENTEDAIMTVSNARIAIQPVRTINSSLASGASYVEFDTEENYLERATRLEHATGIPIAEIDNTQVTRDNDTSLQDKFITRSLQSDTMTSFIVSEEPSDGSMRGLQSSQDTITF